MNDPKSNQPTRTATLAGGCFWCLEAVFASFRGVRSVVPGYTGGHLANPTYEQVCSGSTRHAEAVRITFDPEVISFGEILDIFFAAHDPTTLNRQGEDVGTQYRSAIFYETPEQKAEAEKKVRDLEASHTWRDPVVTVLEPLTAFYPAEDYHRAYYNRHSEQPYCRIVISPKLDKVREAFASRLNP